MLTHFDFDSPYLKTLMTVKSDRWIRRMAEEAQLKEIVDEAITRKST
jgi:hypothetical protein